MKNSFLDVCCSCGKSIGKDDIGANKKLISKNATKFLCIECLAEFLGTDEASIYEKIQKFKEEGCVLFL